MGNSILDSVLGKINQNKRLNSLFMDAHALISEYTNKNVVYVTLKGYESQVDPEFQPVYGLSPDNSILHFCIHFPKTVRIQPVKPPRLSNNVWEPFAEAVKQADMARILSIAAMEAHNNKWVENAIINKERILAGTPVHQIPKTGNNKAMAWIIGNGPSLEETLTKIKPEDTVFCCWHAVAKLVNKDITIHYIGHVDGRIPQRDFEPDNKPAYPVNLIATPYAAPRFLDSYAESPLYVYLGADNYINGFYARLMNSQDHFKTLGSVIHTLMMSAIYAGYRRVGLLGVDLCYFDKDQPHLKKAADDLTEVTTVEDKPAFSAPNFEGYKYGIEEIARKHAQVVFYNGSLGVPFKKFKKI